MNANPADRAVQAAHQCSFPVGTYGAAPSTLTQWRVGTLWCKLLHNEPMWPIHGYYECRTCGRYFPAGWEQPPPPVAYGMRLSREVESRVSLAAGR